MSDLRLNIPEDVWKENGMDVGGEPHDRLYTTIHINGWLFHVEAWRVVGGPSDQYEGTDTSYEQMVVAKDLVDDFHGVGQAFAPNGPFTEIEIRGRPYVLFIFPAED